MKKLRISLDKLAKANYTDNRLANTNRLFLYQEKSTEVHAERNEDGIDQEDMKVGKDGKI